MPAIERCLKVPTYGAVKASTLLEERRKVKSDVRKALGGWIRNEGGENFTLEEPESDTKQKKTKIPK
jgi:tRNA-specific adenosine deaminase 1